MQQLIGRSRYTIWLFELIMKHFILVMYVIVRYVFVRFQADLDHRLRYLQAQPTPSLSPEAKVELEQALGKILEVINERSRIVDELDQKKKEREALHRYVKCVR